MKARPLLAFAALFLLLLACGAPETPPATMLPSPHPATPTVSPVTLPSDARGPGFAAYNAIPVTLPEVYEGYTLPVDLGGVRNARDLSLNTEQAALLSQNGFVVVPADWLEFFQVYEQNRYINEPSFVTTDAVYHLYHLLFDKMLRDLEREFFAPDIAVLTRACLEQAQAAYGQMRGTSMESVARRVWAYFSVADNLINPDATIPAEIADLVEGELALIEAHEGLSASPIFSADCPQGCDPCDTDPPAECRGQPCMCEDYSQYVPRGHYTRSEELQRYFRAMMWYGRINMRLQYPDETGMALLITYILRNTTVNGEPAADVWGRVYEPTVFIVGKADDLGFHEYGALWDAVFGPSAGPESIADDGLLQTFIESARLLPPPQVNSMWVYIWEDEDQVTQGFRFMGQRFTLDAYIFEQMVWREVGTPGNERWLPSGLDVMAAMGSDAAYAILDDMGETAYVNYPEQMARLREQIGALQMDSWTQNLYWNWLYALQPLLEPHGEQYPAFMRTQAWTHKDLHTALGSWTELKHDTILYAKQVMAEMGGGAPPAPPQGWVEPNPEAYARLLALTRMTYDGLESRGLLNDDTAANLSSLDDLLSFLLDVSQRELNSQPLTSEDYERIHYIGGTLEALTLAAADPEEGEGRPYFDEEDQAALVADVATDPNGRVLEEAIGRIFEIYVVVPDASGDLQVARGGVFSYYEFPWPIGDRLTDEAWRQMLTAGQAPDQPAWTADFIAR